MNFPNIKGESSLIKKSYCSEKSEFLKSEIIRIKDIIGSEAFKSGNINKDVILATESKGLLKKDAKESKNFRLKGNSIFKSKKHTLKEHLDIWDSYSKCIASAPNDSIELVQGYYNRASFFWHIHKYKESVKDINRALKLKKADDDLNLKLEKLKEKGLAKIVQGIKNLGIANINKKLYPEYKIKIKKTNERIPCASEAISIDYNEQYGRFIVANRDIDPGELIARENFYSKIVVGDQVFRHCSNCCVIIYHSIPCEGCAYAMYCSEECKFKAWNEYHKIECILLNNIDIRDRTNLFTTFSLRILLKILNEVKEIEHLKNYLEQPDNYSDPLEIGFSEGVYRSDSWSNILNLKISPLKMSEENLKRTSNYSAACLYWLGMNTDLFGKRMKSAAEFIESENAIVFGAFLSRLRLVAVTNSQAVVEEIAESDKRFREINEITRLKYACATVEIGMGITAFSSLFNHSCTPDALPFTKYDGEMFFFALKPIKKGSQVFICYGKDSMHSKKFERMKEISRYGFICDCRACEENWPTFEEAPELEPGKVSTTSLDLSEGVETLLDKNLSKLEDMLRTNKLCYKGIYRIYGIIIDLYRVRYNNWCNVRKCNSNK